MVKSLGWSSGALSHLVEREYKADAPVSWIKRWIIGEGSLTPTPAEPRNSAVPLKSLMEIPTETEQPEGEPEGAGNAPASECEAVKAVISTPVISEPIKEDNIMEITPEIQNLVNASVDTALKAFADKLPTNGNGNVVVTKDEADQPFKSLGEFYMCVKNAGLSPNNMDRRLYATKAPTGIGELLPTEGGFLVPPQYASGILDKMYSTGAILSRVARDPISGNRMIYNAVDESSRADGSRQGGVLGYWLAEAATKTDSHPKWRQVDLKLNKVAALIYATDEILGDVNTLGSWIGRVAPEELRFQVEDAIVEGNGVGKPQGILNANALTTVLRNELLLVAYADIVNMWARRWSQYKDYVWLVNQEVMPQLNSLVLANSSDPNARFASFSADGTLSLMGRPVIECEYCSALGTKGDIILMSPSQYQTIDNGGIESASSIHVKFTSDESVFRFVYRIDGAPLWASALTPFKGSGTLSPYVTLATATA
jgi:HK97 family phage major capsid protein